MPVKPMPEPKPKEIQKFISKGGKTVNESKQDEKWIVVNVRMPHRLLEAVDKACAQTIGQTRNAFLLRIIQEALPYDIKRDLHEK